MTDTYTILQLTPWVRAGLLILSAILAVATLYAARRAHGAVDGRQLQGRLIRHLFIAAGVFWLFVWLTPQIYYLFYMACLPGLPAQMVIGWPPWPAEPARLLWLDFTADLPPIAQGLLGWTLLGQALWHALDHPKRNRAGN